MKAAWIKSMKRGQNIKINGNDCVFLEWSTSGSNQFASIQNTEGKKTVVTMATVMKENFDEKNIRARLEKEMRQIVGPGNTQAIQGQMFNM